MQLNEHLYYYLLLHLAVLKTICHATSRRAGTVHLQLYHQFDEQQYHLKEMATAKSPRPKPKKDRFVTIYMGPVGGEDSTAIIEVPDPLPQRMGAVFRYLNEARYLRNQQKAVLDFFREIKAGLSAEELARLSRRVKQNWDNLDRLSVISEEGSDEAEPVGSGHQSLFVRMGKIKKMVSEEAHQIRKKLTVPCSTPTRSVSPMREPMDLKTFIAKYEKKIQKLEITLSSYMAALDDFQDDMKCFPQAEGESRHFVDFRERVGDRIHHKVTVHEGMVHRVESISAAALLILKKTAKIEAKMREKNPSLLEALEERKRAILHYRTMDIP